MKVQLISFERESKQLEKYLFLYTFNSYPDKIYVCECSCCIEEWKKERMKNMCSTVIINHLWKKYWQKTLKQKQFFSWKKSYFIQKLSMYEMKKPLHPSYDNIKWWKIEYESLWPIEWYFFTNALMLPLQGHRLSSRLV